jgi:hypothetical protein
MSRVTRRADEAEGERGSDSASEMSRNVRGSLSKWEVGLATNARLTAG